jgi:hypothetical protein
MIAASSEAVAFFTADERRWTQMDKVRARAPMCSAEPVQYCVCGSVPLTAVHRWNESTTEPICVHPRSSAVERS